MSVSGVRKLAIKDLTPGSFDFLLVGIIIAKRSPKCIVSKRDGMERGVWGFTIRDSPSDFINVTVWGSSVRIDQAARAYRIGDIVDLMNPRVEARRDEQYSPTTTSAVELSVNLNEGEMDPIVLHGGDDIQTFLSLLRLPTKPPSHYYALCDIKAKGRSLTDQYVNILVAVQRVNAVKKICTRLGNNMELLEIEVMDKTSAGFLIRIFDSVFINMAQNWQPRNTCLFIADIKIIWDNFKNTIAGQLMNKTVATENPNTPEGMMLANFALSAPIQPRQIIDSLADSMTDPDSIVNVMSCKAILDKCRSEDRSDNFTALVYATVISFDIDGFHPLFKKLCSVCRQPVENMCLNVDCLADERASVSVTYDLRISFADHTGSLENCHIPNNNATKIIQCQANEFIHLSKEQKIRLKWNYLLKKVAARLIILPMKSSGMPHVSVAALDKVSLIKYSHSVPIY